MARLSEQIMSISLPTLKILQQQNILTVLDFLQEDTERISTLCSLSFKEIVELKQQLISNHSAVPKTGLEVYQKFISNSAQVSTGIKSLDTLLKGGLLTGNVFEICGPSGDGKTQLCLMIAANISNYVKQEIHYVDTKNDFSAVRLSEILFSQELSSEECTAAMDRIKVTKVNDIYQLTTFIEHLKQLLDNTVASVCRLVIIDSIPAVYFPFLGDTNNEGLGLLNHLMSTMKNVSTENDVIFLIVNLSTSYVDVEDGTEDQNKLELSTEVRPMLGKYWLHAVGTRLLIQRINTTSDERCIKIIKSTYLPVGESCSVRLLQSGYQ